MGAEATLITMGLSDSELFELKKRLPRCGRRVFTETGQYYICNEPVISGVIPCPDCRVRWEEGT